MNLLEIEEETIVVKRADLNTMIKEIRLMRESMDNLVFNAKLDALCDGELVTAKTVCKMMSWSKYQLSNRINDESNPIPMTKDTRGWVMTREAFKAYYDKMFNPKILQS